MGTRRATDEWFTTEPRGMTPDWVVEELERLERMETGSGRGWDILVGVGLLALFYGVLRAYRKKQTAEGPPRKGRMTMMKWLMVFALALVSGCASTGGPFVTNISNAGAGKLTVEKCKLRQNLWTGDMDLRDCQQQEVALQ